MSTSKKTCSLLIFSLFPAHCKSVCFALTLSLPSSHFFFSLSLFFPSSLSLTRWVCYTFHIIPFLSTKCFIIITGKVCPVSSSSGWSTTITTTQSQCENSFAQHIILLLIPYINPRLLNETGLVCLLAVRYKPCHRHHYHQQPSFVTRTQWGKHYTLKYITKDERYPLNFGLALEKWHFHQNGINI